MWRKIRHNLIEWNLFSSEDQNNTTRNNQDEPTTIPQPRLLQGQRISTRLYIISMIS